MVISTKQQNIDAFNTKAAKFDDTLMKHIGNGVVFLSKDGILIDESVEIAAGATILPGTILRGSTKIGTDSVIGPNSELTNVIVGENVTFKSSVGTDSTIGSGCSVGPFTQLRPNSTLGEGVKIGDFVEVKNSTIGDGTSVAHLTYIGDSDVGRPCNFGCGVVTVNYDGENKARTTVGDYCFIGCNTNLIAPVTLQDGAYTAAGSTITKDVSTGSLAVARARQEEKTGWAVKKLESYIKKHSVKK